MANMNIRVDDALKKQAEAVLSDIGLTFSSATTIFLKQIVRHNGIPFELKADPFDSVENQTRLVTAAKRMDETDPNKDDVTPLEDCKKEWGIS